LFNIVLATALSQNKEKSDVTWKVRNKNCRYHDCIENPSNLNQTKTKNLLESISKFSKAAGCTKSIAFLYTSNEFAETEI
jgi:hypothetical protein